MLAAKGELASVVDSSSKLSLVGKAAFAGLAAAAGGVVVAAVHMGTEFQTQLTRLYTAAGAPKQVVLDNANAILQLGNSVGQTGTAMAEALYHPISAGLNMATSLNVVKYAAEEATISGASLDDTTYSLSSVMKAFNLNANDAQGTMASLNAIVGQGDMRFQDFNQSVKNWAPTAAQMGISINSMGAGLAYLTDRGNSAEVAATRMTMGISMMTTPSKQAATLLEGLGVASSDVSASSAAMTSVLQKTGITQNKLAMDLKQPDGLYVALKDLQDGLKRTGVSGTEADSVLAKVFGGGRSDKAIMSLMQNLDGVKQKFDDISKASTAKSFEQNWQDAQKTFGFQMQQIKAAAENALTHLGTVLLPKISAFISSAGSSLGQLWSGLSGGGGSSGLAKLGEFLRPIAADFGKTIGNIAQSVKNLLSAVAPVAQILGGAFLMALRAAGSLLANVVGPALQAVTGFLSRNKEIITVLGGAYLAYKAIMMGIQIATKAWALIQAGLNIELEVNPIMLIVTAVALLVLGVIELIKHWSQVSGFFKGLWNDVKQIFSAAINWVVNIFRAWYPLILGILTGGLLLLPALIFKYWDKIVDFFKNLWSDVSSAFSDGVNTVVNWVKDLATKIQNWEDSIIADAVTWLLNMWDKISTWFSVLPARIGAWLINTVVTLRARWDAMVADVVIWLANMEVKISQWFQALPGKIGGFFKDAGQWLLNAGYNILIGFLNGLINAWNKVTSFIGGIGNWISQHKGPIEYDRQLLVPHGNATMDGYLTGLKQGAGRVGSYLDSFTASIGNTAVAANIGVSGAVTGGFGGAAAGGVTINITTGALLSTKADIKEAVQEAFLQNGMRNVQSGLNFVTT